MAADARFCASCGNSASGESERPTVAPGGRHDEVSESKTRFKTGRGIRFGGIPVIVLLAAYACAYFVYGYQVKSVATGLLHDNGFPNLSVKQVSYSLSAPLNSQSTAAILVTNGSDIVRVEATIDGNPIYSDSTYVELGPQEVLKLRMQL